jgi:hypothetical protein
MEKRSVGDGLIPLKIILVITRPGKVQFRGQLKHDYCALPYFIHVRAGEQSFSPQVWI